MIKKITLTLIALLSSLNAFAGHMNEAMPTASGVNLIAPHQDGYWTFGAQANYFQPNNDFNYAYGSFSTTTSGTPTINDIQSRTFAVDSDNDWGWGVDVTYHFPGEGRDVTLAFTQLNTSDSNSVEVGDGEFATISPMVDGRGEVLRQTTISTEAKGTVSTDYDAVDLTFGQLISVGRRVDLHPFAGLRYAYINYEANAEYLNIEPFITRMSRSDPSAIHSESAQTIKSNFQGVGPRLGSDAAVNLGRGFSLKGTLGVSLLAGRIDASNDYENLTDNGQQVSTILTETTTEHKVDTNTRVVPEADAKLAAAYHTVLDQGYGLGFEIGYQVTNYFNTIVNNTIDTTVSTSTQYTDFFMQGPYARLQLDVA